MASNVVVDLSGLTPTPLQKAQDVVLVHSEPLSSNHPRIRGLNYEAESLSIADLLDSFRTSGFQASNLGQAKEVIEQMLKWRLSDEPIDPEDIDDENAEFSWAQEDVRRRTRATIYLSFTSNMISSGLRESFVYLAKHKLIDVVVTTAGGVEEDFVKCLGEFVVGSFHGLKGKELRSKGWNRIGNIYVPNDNYVKFEAWLQPILDAALEEQTKDNLRWTPSRLIRRMGEKIEDESSLYYWCSRNNIPVYCPSFTDGSIGDILYFHSSRNPGLIVDVVQDIVAINNSALAAKKSGIIILGGGAAKHHVCNANLMRNGADFACYINTAQEFDGCDSGASPDEAISWGKIKAEAAVIKVVCDATIAFPLLTATVFREEAARRKIEIHGLGSTQSNEKLDYILTSPWRR